MFKTFSFFLILSLASSAFAAKFFTVTSLLDSKLETVAKAYEKELNSNVYALLDCSTLLRLKVLKKPSELNLNTMKQLAVMKGRLNHADGETVSLSTGKTYDVVEELITYSDYREYQDEDEQYGSEAFIAKLTNVLDKARTPKIEVYSGLHSFEDGTWSLLQVYDTKNQEVLFLQSGYCGT